MHRHYQISKGTKFGVMENNSFYDVYYDVEVAIDKAFEGRQLINIYQYFKSKGAKRDQVEEFLSSPTCT